jgi:hypothetical protein
MSTDQFSDDIEREPPTECAKCGGPADAVVTISANHDGDPMDSRHGVCFDHLEELGEWFRDGEHDGGEN